MTEENDGFRLHELVYKSDWEKVLLRLKSHPHEALHVVQSRDWLDRRNLKVEDNLLLFDTNVSALHLACARRNPPRRVIQAFLEAQPKSIKILTYRNLSPLSLACISRARLENISLLATADPDALLLQDRKGKNVFHHCCAHILTANTLPVLLNAAGPERTTRALLALDRDGKAPIHLACSRNSGVSKSEFSLIARSTRIQSLNERPLEVLCNEYRENFQSVLSFGAIRDSAVSTDDPTPFCNPRQVLAPERFWMWRPTDALFLRRCWNMAFTLLGADDNDLATYPLLHECLERDVTCRTDMFHYVLCLNPHYACQLRPSDGTLPLHVIARLAAEDGERHWVERIRILVRLYPKGASIPDQDGNLPLELLTRPTVTFDHVAPVLEASTNSLALLHLPESFYPYILFQLTRLESFTTVYQILRDAPTLAMRWVEDKETPLQHNKGKEFQDG